MRIALIECIRVYKTTLGVIRITLAFLARSAMTILATSVNSILLSYIMLSLSANQYKYWQNLAYLVVLGSVIEYRFLLLFRTPIRRNNY